MPRWRVVRRIAIAACALVFMLARVALADIAPPPQQPGSNIGPAGQTQVQMRAERIVIDVPAHPLSAERPTLSGDEVIAQVSGVFLMHNLGSADEQLQVRFPIADLSGNAGPYGTPAVQDFSATVADQPVATTVITTPNPDQPDAPPMRWAAFDTTFPAGQDVNIGVTYTITPTGYFPEARFGYVLETGAEWRDSIGSADVIVQLPYATSSENVVLGKLNGSDQIATSPGAQFVGNEVRWHWDNLEPTANDNLFFTIIAPSVWQAILDARAAVQAQPNDTQALVALAKAYNAAMRFRFPTSDGDPYAALSEQTYERAIATQPDSATLHSDFARLLWDHLAVQAALPPDDPHIRQIVHELSVALALDPQNTQALTLLEEVRGGVTGAIALETPVAQPEPSLIPTPEPPTPASASPSPAATIAPPAATIAPPTSAAPAPTSASLPTVAPSAAVLVPTPASATPVGPNGVPLPFVLLAVLAIIVAIVVVRRRQQL